MTKHQQAPSSSGTHGRGKGASDKKPWHGGKPMLGKVAYQKKKMEELKKEKERGMHQKAKMLRDYAKLCKREGVSSDRVNLDPNWKKSADGAEDNVVASSSSSQRSKKNKDSFNPIQAKKMKQMESKRKEEEDARRDAAKAREEKDKMIQEKTAKREADRKARMKRTRKGQPVMAAHISGLLEKIKNNV
jgi:hypothetical protein